MTSAKLSAAKLDAPRSRGLPGDSDDIRKLVILFRRRLWLFSSIVAVVFAAACVAAVLAKPVYSALSTIKIDPNQHSALDNTPTLPGSPPDSALVDTEVSLIKSHDVAVAVAKRLNLTNDPEFTPKGAGFKLFGSHVAAGQPDTALERATSALQRKVSVARDGSTYIVRIVANSGNPDKAAAIANAVAEEYINFSQRQKMEAAQAQESALSSRAGELQSQAETASAQVAAFKASAGITDTAGAGGTATDQQEAALATQLSLARSDAAAANSKADAARAQIAAGALDSVSEVMASPIIVDLEKQRSQLVTDQAQTSARYGPRHPESIRVTNQLAQVDAQIRAESQRVVDGLTSDALAASARARDLQGQLGALQAQQASNARAGVQAAAMQRRADALAALANNTTEVVQRAGEQAQVGETQGRIATLAAAPTAPSYPNRPLFAVLGLFLGGLLGLTTIFVLETFNSTILSEADIENVLGVPYISSIPLLPRSYLQGTPGGKTRKPGVTAGAAPQQTQAWDHVIDHPLAAFAESLRATRSAIKLSSGEAQVLTLTSALPNEGKSTTAVALARIMAMNGDKVLLIDGDVRRNALRWLTPTPATVGLVEVLNQTHSVNQALVSDKVPGLDILPLVHTDDIPPDLLGSPKLAQLLVALKERYDHIIIDGPPVLAVADARFLAAASDGVLLVVRWNKTPRQAILSALSRLESDSAPIAGALLAMVDLKARAYLGEYDAQYYYRKYKNYYSE